MADNTSIISREITSVSTCRFHHQFYENTFHTCEIPLKYHYQPLAYLLQSSWNNFSGYHCSSLLWHIEILINTFSLNTTSNTSASTWNTCNSKVSKSCPSTTCTSTGNVGGWCIAAVFGVAVEVFSIAVSSSHLAWYRCSIQRRSRGIQCLCIFLWLAVVSLRYRAFSRGNIRLCILLTPGVVSLRYWALHQRYSASL